MRRAVVIVALVALVATGGCSPANTNGPGPLAVRFGAALADKDHRGDARLCRRLRPHAQDLVDAFAFAPEHVRAPIASGAERARQDEARAHYADLAASGSAPVSEKSLKKK